jgi:CRP-like cAMP-binding protein
MSDPTPTLSTGLFKGLASEDADGILQAGERLSFPAGQAIFEAGDAGDAMFVIASGQARVDVGGRFHIMKPGDFFGEMALLAPGPRMATVKAEADVEAIKIGAEEFQAFLLAHPAVGLSMMKQLVIRLREVEQRIDAWMA